MFIARPDAQLHVLSFGQGPVTLLAVGGWIAAGEVWLDLFGHLPNWRCVAIDHRGAGASTHHGSITVDAMADDILAVAEALQLGPCVLAAESAGAAVALQVVQRAPRRFLGQVLVGAAWQRLEPGATDGFVAQLRADYPATLRAFIDSCLPESRSVALRRWALQMLIRSSVDHAVELLNCRTQLPPDHTLPSLNLPTLLLHGAQDRVVPYASALQLAAQLPQSEVHLLPGLGHVPIVTAPEEVARLIDGFGWRLSVSPPAAPV